MINLITVDTVDSRGNVVFRAAADSYVLAQQVDSQSLRSGQVLKGTLAEIGISTATDPESGAVFSFFVEAYDLSREAALAVLS